MFSGEGKFSDLQGVINFKNKYIKGDVSEKNSGTKVGLYS